MRSFSALEIRDITISLVALSLVFSFPEFLTEPFFFVTSLLVVGVAFMGHELSHKFTAIRYGFWSEYRMWPQGIMMAVLFALASGGAFIFAAPGAVYFSGGSFFNQNMSPKVPLGLMDRHKRPAWKRFLLRMLVPRWSSTSVTAYNTSSTTANPFEV